MLRLATRFRVEKSFRHILLGWVMGIGMVLALVGMAWCGVAEASSGVDPASGFGRVPMAFEPAEGGAFVSRGPGYVVRLTSGGAAFWLRREGRGSAERRRERLGGSGREVKESWVGMRLAGVATGAVLEGVGEGGARVNYLLGNDPAAWRLRVPTFGAVRATGVYPGVDLLYYGNQNQLEFDFDVAPGVDPGVIRLVYAGIEGAEVEASGDLVIHTGAGRLRQQRPVVYQETAGVRRRVEGGYRLLAGGERSGRAEVGFELGAYDRTRRLVIDPVFYYSTYMGGLGEDVAWDVTVGPDGLAIVTGETASSAFPLTNAFSTNYAGGFHDLFVAKVGPQGTNLVFSTYIGGNADDVTFGIAVGPGGDIYLAGATASTNFPVSSNAVSRTIHGIGTLGSYEYDGFLMRLDATATQVKYSTYLGGGFDDNALAVAVDDVGAAYVAGFTQSTDFLPQVGGGGMRGIYDAFVLKLTTATNQLEYGYLLGGDFDDRAQGIAVNGQREAWVAGYASSTNFPVTGATNPPVVGAWQPVFGGGLDDAWVAKVGAGGALAWCSYLGGSGSDEAFRLALDPQGRPVVVGMTASTNFPVVGALVSTNAGLTDWFIARLDPAGAGPWYSTYVGGNLNDEAWGVAVGPDGSVHVAGNTLSTNFPVVKSLPRIYTAAADAVLLKLTPAGDALAYSTTVGGVNVDQGYAVAVDGAGVAFLAGSTTSLDFPVVPGTNALQGYLGGFVDAFVARVLPGDATLSVTGLGNGDLRIAWSTNLVGYRLYGASTVPTSTNWVEVTLPVGVMGSEFEVVIPNGGTNQFFQLRR